MEGYRGDEYLYDAVSSVGTNLAGAIRAYHERHQQMRVLDAEMEHLTHIMDVPDKYGNRKPVLDPKAYERMKAHNERERYTLEVAAMQAMEFGTQLQQAHANINKARLEERYSGQQLYLYRSDGTPYAQWNERTHTYVKMPQPGEGGDVGALHKHANTMLAKMGQTSTDFAGRTGEERGFVPLEQGQFPGDAGKKFQKNLPSGETETNAVRYKVGGKTYVQPEGDFNIIRKVYPREGDPEYVEPIKVGQPQGGQPQGGGGAPTYPIGTKARFGNTWKIMTDKGWQVINQQTGNAAIGSGQGDTGDEGQ